MQPQNLMMKQKANFPRSRMNQHMAVANGYVAIISQQDCMQKDHEAEGVEDYKVADLLYEQELMVGYQRGLVRSIFVVRTDRVSREDNESSQPVCVPLKNLIEDLKFEKNVNELKDLVQ